jgi:DNA-binding MarR family transcriptional regulator
MNISESSAERIVAGLAKLGLVLKSHAWRQAGGRGLTPTQAQALAALESLGKPSLRLQEVAEALAIREATASEAVESLVSKGLVRKKRSGVDRRAVAISLTAKGKQEAVQVMEWPDYLLGAVGDLTQQEQEALLWMLIKMVRSLQRQGKISVARMCVNCRYFEPFRYPDRAKPHHCGFVNAPLGVGDLRLDCRDFEAAEASDREKIWSAMEAKTQRGGTRE